MSTDKTEFTDKHLETIKSVFSTIIDEGDDGANICGVLIRKLKSLKDDKIVCPHCSSTFTLKEE